MHPQPTDWKRITGRDLADQERAEREKKEREQRTKEHYGHSPKTKDLSE